MTKAQWKTNMARYMHRNDLTGDLDTAFTFAKDMFFNAWPVSNPEAKFTSDDDIVTKAPRVMHHGGLLYLHELAQDDVGMSREYQRFAEALSDFARNYSLNNIDPVMTRPYYPEEMTDAP